MVYLAMAFVAVWVLVTGYVFFMSRRQNSLDQEMGMLEELVSESSASGTD